ncbi:hypothetical protein ACS0TY_012595 [Phlomoides rotata]
MLCFQSFGCLRSVHHFVRGDTKQRNRAAIVKFAASIIPQAAAAAAAAESNRNSSDAKTDQTNGIGILGGYTCLSFAKKLVDQEIELPFILCTDPAPRNELLSLDRSLFPSLSGKPEASTDHSSIVKNLRRKRAFLEESGVSCIVMPCHMSHYWYDEIKDGCSVPFLHMGESVAKELEESKLRPIEAGSSVCIAVLATSTTLVTRMYQEKLENEGFKVVIPDKNTMKHIVIPAVEALSSEDVEGARNLFRIALQILLMGVVNKIVLASDELRKLLPPDDPLWRKCIDPTDALARSTIKYALSANKQT